MGDAVLQLFVSTLIFNEYPTLKEGEMSLIRSRLVRSDSLCELAKNLGLGEYLILGHGEEKSGGRNRKNILADAFESLMAAIYLDQGYEKSLEVVTAIFLPLVKKIKIDDLLDYKTKLQELVQADKRKTVEYRELSRSGTANDPTYVFEVVLEGEIVLAQGVGKSKKAAQQDAAKNALEKCAL
jgi:ribonuclease-3